MKFFSYEVVAQYYLAAIPFRIPEGESIYIVCVCVGCAGAYAYVHVEYRGTDLGSYTITLHLVYWKQGLSLNLESVW